MKPTVVVGAGIVGLAAARALQRRDPDRPIIVVDKEADIAAHQTGHNSGVIHSGLYYRPGSLKARLAVSGAAQLKEYCQARGLGYDVPGKLVVAVDEREVGQLQRLEAIGLANGVAARRPTADEVTEREPHVRVRAALEVPSTGRADYPGIARSLAEEIVADGGQILTGIRVESIQTNASTARVLIGSDGIEAERVAVCAGLHSDRLARASGLEPEVRILPFRGEYSELTPERAHLVNGLVYPVPDPDLPFLGVHLTKGLDGVVHLGPNAVPALAREGYTWSQIAARDLWESVSYPGAWRLGRRYARTGLRELTRSLRGQALVREAQRMLPELTQADVRRSGSGVRAQAVTRDGRLVDDFLFARDRRTLHVLNAPSPAATACLPIGEHIARELIAR